MLISLGSSGVLRGLALVWVLPGVLRELRHCALGHIRTLPLFCQSWSRSCCSFLQGAASLLCCQSLCRAIQPLGGLPIGSLYGHKTATPWCLEGECGSTQSTKDAWVGQMAMGCSAKVSCMDMHTGIRLVTGSPLTLEGLLGKLIEEQCLSTGNVPCIRPVPAQCLGEDEMVKLT